MMRFCSCIVVEDDDFGGGGGVEYPVVMPMMAITTKELSLRGSFRFHPEFATAVSLMQKGLIDVSPLITQTFPLEQAVEAFETAGDRSRAIKAQLRF